MDWLHWPNTYNKIACNTKHIMQIYPHTVLSGTSPVIYGAGFEGIKQLGALRKNGVCVSCFCDSSPQMTERKICGITVIGKDELLKLERNVPIIVAVRFHSYAIEAELLQYGFTNILIADSVVGDHCAMKFYQNGMNARMRIYEKALDKVEFVKSHITDEQSRRVLEAHISLWLKADWCAAKEVITDDSYYPQGIIELRKNEVFVDCGAYTGDSAYEFYKITDGEYEKIYAYEADELSYEMAKAFLAWQDVHDVELRNIGVFDKKGVLNFISEDNVANRISDEGIEKINVDTLDNLLKKRTAPVTYIKMDIEGAEMEALVGASSVIRGDRPKLAISVYHKFADIWELPYYILTSYPNYRIFFRKNYIWSDCVCFFVPNDLGEKSNGV